MFYVFERKYKGQDKEEFPHVIEIKMIPEMGDTAGERIIRGLIGTTNNWADYAHGAYETEAAARREVKKMFPMAREVPWEYWEKYYRGQDVIADVIALEIEKRI